MRFGTPRQAAEAGVRAAVRALATGRMVVVADDREREDEGDLVAVAALMSAEQMAFFLRHGSGIVCAPMSDERANGRVSTRTAVTAHNVAYLRTKRDRMGHDLDLPAQLAQATRVSLGLSAQLGASGATPR